MSEKMRKGVSWTAFHDKPIMIFSRRFCSQEEAKRSFKNVLKVEILLKGNYQNTLDI